MLDNGGYLIWTTVFELLRCWLLNQRIPIGTAQIVPSGSHDKFPPYFPLLPLFTECSSLSCSHWLAAWLGLPSRPESVAPSSDSPPINRYSMLSCSLALPDVSLIYPCCLPLVWPFDSDWTEYTATLYILLISDACLGSNIFFWLKLLCLFHFFPISVLLFKFPSVVFPVSLSPTSYRSVNLCICLIWFWAYHSSLRPSCFLPHLLHRLYQHAIFFDGKEKSFIWKSCHLKLLFQWESAEKVILKSCKKSLALDAVYVTPQSPKRYIFFSLLFKTAAV